LRVLATSIPGVVLIEPDVYRDARGFFLETYQARRYAEHGVKATFVQDNQSLSCRDTLRGLHFQVQRPQAKLVRVIAGEIFDVVVDVRRGSPTFGRWTGASLSAENFLQCYIPPGFAHGFAVTSAAAAIEYKCSDFYDPATELGLAWDDPDVGIKWPVETPILSERDRRHPRLQELMARLPLFDRD
jgi:dTDP-4-dehydrorhamnose 3,5-epimerase